MVLGESRSDLLHWLHTSFDLNYTKVEQCGTGAAYCQIMDSIYGGVPLQKVKFDPHLSDYDARANMKVLQAAFNRHKITRRIDTERLIKCRLQDNLELLQWLKRHWMENKDVNVEYDASSRRSGLGTKAGSGTGSGPGSSAATSRRNTMTAGPYGSGHTTPRARSRDPSRSGGRIASTGSVSSSTTGTADSLFLPKRGASGTGSGSVAGTPRTVVSVDVSRDLEQKTHDLSERTRELQHAKEEIQECKMMMDTLETERNFYYNKLREIEILVKRVQDHASFDHYMGENSTETHVSPQLADVVSEIQTILFATETGFEGHDSGDVESF